MSSLLLWGLYVSILLVCSISTWCCAATVIDFRTIVRRITPEEITPEEIAQLTSLETEVLNNEVFIIIHPNNQFCLGEKEVPQPQDD